MKTLFIDVLGVEEHQADVDTCKIEHLLSDDTAERASQLLFFIQSGAPEAEHFFEAWSDWEREREKQSKGAEEFPSREIESLRHPDSEKG